MRMVETNRKDSNPKIKKLEVILLKDFPVIELENMMVKIKNI